MAALDEMETLLTSRFVSSPKPRVFGSLTLTVALGLCATGCVQAAGPAVPPLYLQKKAPMEQRVEDLFSRLTQTEKLGLLSGTGFATRAIPRLGVPPMQMADAPQGVRGGGEGTTGPASLFPSGVAMASTWDREAIQELGVALGQETRGKGPGVDILLGPCVNIHRSPQGGRNAESYSEDPYLAAQITVPYILGVQSQGTAACVKHFALNNEETDRMDVDVRVDERTFREIYMPAFEAAVHQGHVWTVMSSYNKINGYHATANHHLLTDVLKNDWGFDGLVMSDWGAVHETVGVVNAGNDLEMPDGQFLSVPKLEAALASGEIKQASIDDSVRRIIRTLIRTGLLDGPKSRDPKAINSPSHQRVAFRVASEGMVLLKNDHNVLPLDRHKIKTIAVIGPNAAVLALGNRESANVEPVYTVSPLEGIRHLAGSGIKINYVEGVAKEGDINSYQPVPASALLAAGTQGQHGLKAEYFPDPELSGAPAGTQVESTVDHNWSASPGFSLPQDRFGIRWTGQLVPPKTATYTLALTSDDGSRLYLDGKLLIDNWGKHAPTMVRAQVPLEAGQPHDLRIDYNQTGGGASIRFGWSENDANAFQHAVEAAAQADAVVVCAGVSDYFEGEGLDRASLNLPSGQDALIEAVSKANRNTIVVLNSGTPNIMTPWIDSVPSVIQAWYPGEEGGNALAAILFGDVNPSGKLPDTFAVAREDYPDYGHFPGTNGTVQYAEGLYVGYRHFDKANIKPLFPFGYGLSYTTFRYTPVQLDRATLSGNGTVQAHLNVTNTGKRAGAEIVQLYIHPVNPKVDRPVRELKCFQRVTLNPGQTKTVTFTIDPRSLAYYDVDGHKWQTDSGDYIVEVGASSRDIKSQQTLNVP